MEISKYRGIIENILTEEQVEHVLSKSKLDEVEQEWRIAKFTLK